MCEAIGLLYDSFSTSSNSSVTFTKKIIEKYVEDANIFRALLNSIEQDRYNNVTLGSRDNDEYGQNNTDTYMATPTFLTKCFSKLGVNYFPGHTKTRYYGGYAKRQNNTIDYSHSEIYYYIDRLVENYTKLKTSNYSKFLELKNDIISLIEDIFKNTSDLGNIVYLLITSINNILIPKDNPELINDYFGILASKKIASAAASVNNITPNSLSINLDTSPFGDTVRDYTFTLFAVQKGDKFMVKNETNRVEVYFNIGEKIKGGFETTTEITIKGRLRMSIIDGSGNIKNIAIPIKSTIKPKQKNNSVPSLSSQSLSQVQKSITDSVFQSNLG
jgi:hypothetical protein